jgi:hypothetical protein
VLVLKLGVALHRQAMVPLWDALNHVTGRCNVRLHHDEDDECLQMIATGQALASLGQQSIWSRSTRPTSGVLYELVMEVARPAVLMWRCCLCVLQSPSQQAASSSTTTASWATQSSCGDLALWSGIMCTTVLRHAACRPQATWHLGSAM